MLDAETDDGDAADSDVATESSLGASTMDALSVSSFVKGSPPSGLVPVDSVGVAVSVLAINAS